MKERIYKLMCWPDIEAIVYGEEKNPQTILGRHYMKGFTLYQTFVPGAKAVTLLLGEEKVRHEMEMADEAGFFAITVIGKERRDYEYEVIYKDDQKIISYDPYCFDASLTKEEALLWNSGTLRHAYKYMGAHFCKIDGIYGVRFRVWAPNALRVSVIGEFNQFRSNSHPMSFDEDTGVFSLFIPGIDENSKYCYQICAKGGKCISKIDPYANHYYLKSDCNDPIIEDTYNWTDTEYMKNRVSFDKESAVINIYQLNEDLWNDNDESIYTKKIDDLCSYIVRMNYTHVYLNVSGPTLCVINEDFCEAALKCMINRLHNVGVGVILRWNPCYFARQKSALCEYDGTYLYGHLDERKRVNGIYGYNFNYGRAQVDNYLISSLDYWLEEFHIDGVYIGALSSILYLDYGKQDNFLPNIYGGNENLEAIEFIKQVNTLLHKDYPGCISIAYETCMFPKVTSKIEDGGLGFDYICNNGFGDDLLAFVKSLDVDTNKLINSMSYEYSEDYLLTISREDVLKANVCEFNASDVDYFDCIDVEEKRKKALKRAVLSFIMARPGKKLIYHGQDDNKLSEKLGTLYKNLPAFYELDRYQDGFEWVSSISNGTGVVAFIRRAEIFRNNVLVICNFSYNEYEEYKLGLPYEGKYKCFFCSQEKQYGGEYKLTTKRVIVNASDEAIVENALSSRAIDTTVEDYDDKECTITVKLPPMSVSYYSYEPYSLEEFLKIAAKKAALIKKQLEKEAERRAKELENEAVKKAKEYNRLTKNK